MINAFILLVLLMPFYGPLKLAEPDAPSTGALPGQSGYTSFPTGTSFRLGGQQPGQSYLDLITQQLQARFPGMSGLTSYPGSQPGTVGALGFNYGQPTEAGTLEGVGAVSPESLTALLSGVGAPLTVEQLIGRVNPSGAPTRSEPTAPGASSIARPPAMSTMETVAPGGSEGLGVGPGTGASGATAGPNPAVTNPAGALGITGPSVSLGPLGSINPVETIANQAARGITFSGISPVGMAQAVQGLGSMVSDIMGVSPQMDPQVAAAINQSQQYGMAYGTSPTSGLASLSAAAPSAGPQGSVNFASPISTLGNATGVSSTGVAFGGPGQSPNLNTPEAQAQNLNFSTARSDIAAGGPGTAGPSGTGIGEDAGGVSSTSTAEGQAAAGAAAPGDTGGGGGGGGAGGTVICTVLHDYGLMDDATWEKDRQFGLRVPVHVYQGYLIWAKPLSRWMRKSWLIRSMVASLALPWARFMATGEGFIGKIVMRVGWKVCGYLGNLRQRGMSPVPGLSKD